MAWGGKRENAGRPPKEKEEKLKDLMDSVADPAMVINKLWSRIEEGDTKAIDIWMRYRFGMPKQSIDVTTDGEKIAPPIEWVSSKK